MKLLFQLHRWIILGLTIGVMCTACAAKTPEQSGSLLSQLRNYLHPEEPSGSLIYLSDHALHQYDLTTKVQTPLAAASDFLEGAATGLYLNLTPDKKILLFDGYDPLIGCSTYRRIYQCGETGPNGFFTYDLTNNAVNLIRPYTQSNISLSPDGSQLAFTVQEFETSDYQVHLKLSPVGGGEPVSLSGSHVVDSFPSWSPDGQWIAFYRSPSPDPDAAPCSPQPGLFDSCTDPLPSVYIVHPDGTGLTKLLENVRLFYAPYNQPEWSADSQTLAVISGSPDARIAFINIKDQTIIKINDLAPTSVPVWSSTQRIVAFSIAGASEEDGYVVVYDINDKSWRIVAAGSTPVWSPDGQWLAYLEKVNDRVTKLMIVSLDGKTHIDPAISNVFSKPIWVK